MFPKILNMVIYSHDEIYQEMYNLSLSYYSKFSNIDTYYISYKSYKNYKNKEENEENEENEEKNVKYFEGEESIVPGVLDKTIKALLHFSSDIKDKYDYVIRTNISTLIDYKKLNILLSEEQIDYGGGLVNTLNWLDPPSGINSRKYFGTKFVSGTCIIMSKDVVLSLLSKRNFLNYTIIDDVSIGILFRYYFPKLRIKDIKKFIFVDNLTYLQDLKSYIFYRHKTKNRKDDIINMSRIINLIS